MLDFCVGLFAVVRRALNQGWSTYFACRRFQLLFPASTAKVYQMVDSRKGISMSPWRDAAKKSRKYWAA